MSCSKVVIHGWIIDTWVTDNMTLVVTELFELQMLNFSPLMTLPNGQTNHISQIGKVRLKNGVLLNDVLVVPNFKFSLLYVAKLTKDNNCFVSFYPKFCDIQDLTTRKVLGLVKKKHGLYHFLNLPLNQIHSKL